MPQLHRSIFKAAAADSAIEQITLLVPDLIFQRIDLRVEVPIHYIDVPQPVIIEVDEPYAPTHVWITVPLPRAGRRIAEHGLSAALAFVMKNSVCVARKDSDDSVEPPVIVVIREIDSHPCLCVAVFIVSNARRHCELLKSSITLILEQKVWSGVVGDKDIEVAVIVIIYRARTQAIVRCGLQTAPLGLIGKCSIAIVVEEDTLRSVQPARTAGNVNP